MRRFLLTTLAVLAWQPDLLSQTPARTEAEMKASYEAHQGDFDYLLGDWEFTATSKEYGKFHGIWSAVRLPEGAHVWDEYRITGDSGETWYVTTTIRAYNAVRDQWELVGMDRANGLNDMGTARKVGDEMHIEQRFGVMSPTPSVWRIRYYHIRPDGFSWAADRSTDDGRTWVKDYQTLEARRIGPARSLPPLTVARKAPPNQGAP